MMVYKIDFKIENRRFRIDLTELKLKTRGNNKQEVTMRASSGMDRNQPA